ncbi:MAG TPA: acireductone synthase [Thermoanaerobaculia bacterium]|nr:acireductone synthase [Thermoanaerobaculia bacterium]
MSLGAVLTDIEGTTTSISFVYDVLFPYAAARLEEYCSKPDPDPELADALAHLRREHAEEAARDASLPPFGNGAGYARRLMAEDRKSTGLKLLQGVIWDEGYRTGALRSHVFPDVPPALAAWRAAGIRLRVFSSGSVRAQKLLFAHTGAGDLTPLFEGFHDTTTGPKREATSYTAIAEAYALPAGEILFLSDVREELDAAAEAGMQTGLLVRPGNRSAETGGHRVYGDFGEAARDYEARAKAPSK